MSAVMVTLIFLLASGAPAKSAYVTCEGLSLFLAGEDGNKAASEGSRLLLDKRGATIVIGDKGQKLTCFARYAGESAWQDITLRRTGVVEIVQLKGDS